MDGVLRDTYRYFIDYWNRAYTGVMFGEFRPPYRLKPFEEWVRWDAKGLHNGEDPFSGVGALFLRRAMRKAPSCDKAVDAAKVLRNAGHHVYIVTACDAVNNAENVTWMQWRGLSNIPIINLKEKWRLALDIMIDDDPNQFDFNDLDYEKYIINQPWTDYEMKKIEFVNWTHSNHKRRDSLWEVAKDIMRQE